MTATPEDAARYLKSVNFKAFLEWMTAEALVHRPEDPYVFFRDTLAAKVSDRGEEPFKPEETDVYLQDTYKEAGEAEDALVSEGKASGSGGDGEEDETTVQERLALLEKLIDAFSVIGKNLDPWEATENIIKEACRVLKCDRTTLFRMDPHKNELHLLVAKDLLTIRLPLGQGIAGTVAMTGEVVNIPDCYSDARFDPSTDMKTGYKTRNMLCVPVRDGEGRIVGVLQSLNSERGSFGKVDEDVMEIFAAQAGIVLQNAEVFSMVKKSQEKVESLLEIIRIMHADLGINSLLFTLTQRAHSLVEADRCTVYLVDPTHEELFAMQGELNIRFPIGQGIAGSVAATGEIINIPDAYEDDRFNQKVDIDTGYRTKSILTLPIYGSDHRTVVGVIQVLNKAGGEPFDEDDVKLCQTFLLIAGPILQNSMLFKIADKDEGTEFSGKKIRKAPSKSRSSFAMLIEEGDEEEEEETVALTEGDEDAAAAADGGDEEEGKAEE
eukprot:PLAT11033.1.p2 GENE.PLAT11033.1~~PLAT11033.1.p2  ORF type:complete len:495 (+),score=270.36 PLAT11033.1:36-1520(+)